MGMLVIVASLASRNQTKLWYDGEDRSGRAPCELCFQAFVCHLDVSSTAGEGGCWHCDRVSRPEDMASGCWEDP